MRQTPIDEFVLDHERLIVPGTEDPDAVEDGFGRVRRGLVDENWGTLGEKAGAFVLVDSAGDYLLTGQYRSAELRAPLFKALRDLLDVIDPLPETKE